MKKLLFVIYFSFSYSVFCQYTDQINSNRPGYSIGAFSVGKGVVQLETGFEFRNYKHVSYNQSTIDGTVAFLSLRWGFLFEQLELTYDGSFMFDKFTNKLLNPNLKTKRSGFLQNFIGVKYLVYDPFKKEIEINPYSWKENNRFKIKDLIPAVSLTIGANFDPFINETPYPNGDVFGVLYMPGFEQNLFSEVPVPSPLTLMGTLATQSHFLSTWVFITNFSIKRYLSDFIEKSFIMTLTHAYSPVWSVYVENQIVSSEIYSDNIFRAGTAYLVGRNLQIEGTFGTNTSTSPSFVSINVGASYRVDLHKAYKNPLKKQKKKDKKDEKELKKRMRKEAKEAKKRDKRARKKPKN